MSSASDDPPVSWAGSSHKSRTVAGPGFGVKTTFGLAPEQALCIGNAISFMMRPKFRLTLRLKEKARVGQDTWTFRFEAPQRITFSPGQHMEWTLPHKAADARGQRRYFTIASSPTEQDMSIVMRVPDSPSTYKRALAAANVGCFMTAARLSGDFVLPHDLHRPIAFIAGGVGIAPFRSMAQYVVDNGIRCNIVLLYSSRRAADILFQDTFDRAARLGMRNVFVLTDVLGAPDDWGGRTGRIDAEMIAKEVPDYCRRTFYVSGSRGMVKAMVCALRELRVGRGRIHTDYFDGSVDQEGLVSLSRGMAED